MTRIYTLFLEENIELQRYSIQSYTLGNEKVWLKKAAPRHSSWIYLPIAWLARLLNLSMLQPVPNYGGKKSIACEIARIKQLDQLGVHVPTILASSSNAILLKDLAKDDIPVYQLQEALMKEKRVDSRIALYQTAIQQILKIHDLNGYLSEAFSRNILIDKNKSFSFIDFETDPGQYLSLHECQTRDWLCFIFSTATCFSESELPLVCDCLVRNLKHKPEIFHDIGRVGQKIQWILKLNPAKFGADGRRLKQSILLLSLIGKARYV